jgi:prophage tail gpP-like protein
MAPPAPADVRIRVNGRDFTDWLDYQIESDILQPADAFSFTLENVEGRLNGLIAKHDAIEVLVDGTVQLTGYVDGLSWGGDAGSGNVLAVEGRDRFGQLLDVSAEPETIKNLDLKQIAAKVGSPYITQWRVENEDNRKRLQTARKQVAKLSPPTEQEKAEAERERRLTSIRIQTADVNNIEDYFALTPAVRAAKEKDAIETLAAQTSAAIAAESARSESLKKAKANLAAIRAILYPRVKVDPGQTKWAVLEKVVARQGFAIWQAANGVGVIARPNYDQAAQYNVFLHPASSEDAKKNNVLSWSVTDNGREQFARYRLVGNAANTLNAFGENSRYDETGETDGIPLDRQLISAGNGQNKAEARRELARDIDRRNFESLELNYTIPGHAQNGRLWQVDTIVDVDDQVTGYAGQFYCVRRRFTVDVNGGQITEISLRKKGIWLAE